MPTDLMPDSDIRKLFRSVDKDGSGEVESHEFSEWMIAQITQVRVRVLGETMRLTSTELAEIHLRFRIFPVPPPAPLVVTFDDVPAFLGPVPFYALVLIG